MATQTYRAQQLSLSGKGSLYEKNSIAAIALTIPVPGLAPVEEKVKPCLLAHTYEVPETQLFFQLSLPLIPKVKGEGAESRNWS